MPTAASARSSSRGSAPSTGCCRRASPERTAKGERLSMARKNPKPPRAARIAPGAAPAPGPLDLEEARGRIDAVDEKIQALINEQIGRAACRERGENTAGGIVGKRKTRSR